MSVSDDRRMSPLERRCRLLLRAYPLAYRAERGEEIIGTLLEVMPGGRAWPPPRDVLALIIGGLRARAVANRRLSTTSDIRLGVLLGVAMLLSACATSFLQDFATSPAAFATAHDTAASGWRELLAGLLTSAAVTCAWRGRRRTLVACAAAAAAAVIWLLIHQPAYTSARMTVTTLSASGAGCILLCLAALILLTRRTERPSRSWLWLIGLIIATEILQGLAGHLLVLSWPSPLLPLIILIVPIAWIAVDARPALGLATYLALEVVAILGISARPLVLAQAGFIWPLYPALLAAGGLALWRLRRRQAVH